MKELGKIITDGRGTEKSVYPSRIPTIEQNTIIFPDKKQYQVDWRRNFEHLNEMSEIVRGAELVQEEGTYNAKITNPNLPFAVAFITSDLHIGAYNTDHKLIRGVLETVLTTDNSAIIDAGDTFNNGIWGTLGYEDSLPPFMQTFTVEDIIRELGDRWACTALGNHTEWMFSAGVLPEQTFAQQMKGVIFPGMGLLHFKAGKENYDIVVSHNYWGKSKKNVCNVCVNLRQTEYPDAEVFIVGHEHINAHMSETIDDKQRYYIRPGTAKLKDRYARIHGIAKRGQPMGKIMLLGTEKHRIKIIDLPDLSEELSPFISPP